MADFTQTITVGINLFGIAPSNKWNDYNWNEFIWGEGTAGTIVRFQKLLTNNQGFGTGLIKSPVRVLDSAGLTIDADMGSESLTDGSGFNHVFPDRTTEGENRDFPDWSVDENGSATWSEPADTNTDWTES